MQETSQPSTSTPDQPGAGSAPGAVQGRSVFVVETTPAGMAIQTAFLAETGQLLQAPAVFPDLVTALNEVDQLRQLLIQQFSQAARVGAQVLAAEAARAAQASATTPGAAADQPAPSEGGLAASKAASETLQ